MFTTNNGDRAGVDNVIILVTDGYSNIRQQDTLRIARNIKRQDAAIHVIAVGERVDMTEVNAIAGKSAVEGVDDYIHRLMEERDIQEVALALSRRLCQ